MPIQKYKEIYNGNSLVLRKIQKQAPKASSKPQASVPVEGSGLQTVAAPAKTLDAKAMRAKLTAELFRSL